jgi:DNA-binding CsgD family transcriptional regulator
MYETNYVEVGQSLQHHQAELIRHLWHAVDACTNLDTAPSLLQHLVQSLADAFFIFLHDWEHHRPQHLGEILNQARATPMFLMLLNKTLRGFCLTYLEDQLLVAGLEAVADFFLFVMQAYIQTNQSVLQIEAFNKQKRDELLSVLTQHETISLMYLARGLTNKRIAEGMKVTERSVVNYLNRARRKLGTSSRAETMLEAVRLFGY